MSFSTTPMNINFLVSCSRETFSQSLILFEISQKSMNGPESVILGHLPYTLVFSLFVKNSQQHLSTRFSLLLESLKVLEILFCTFRLLLSSLWSQETHNPGQNIWQKVKKASKIEQYPKTLKSIFSQFNAKLSSLQGTSDTKICTQPNMRFS